MKVLSNIFYTSIIFIGLPFVWLFCGTVMMFHNVKELKPIVLIEKFVWSWLVLEVLIMVYGFIWFNF